MSKQETVQPNASEIARTSRGKTLGVDLGTTNCALAWATANGERGLFAIEQLIANGETAASNTLPSFLLLPTEEEVPLAAMKLPWQKKAAPFAVGTFARTRGEALPHRLVSSAKSWLCAGVDRHAPILPWRIDDTTGEHKISPVNASARYLAHLRQAWDHAADKNGDLPLDEHDLVMTVPASFDTVARDLTLVAAQEAGFPEVALLEEPLAAFYAFLAAHPDAWRKLLSVGDVVLVCDIGGGTTDFSLIEIRDDGGNLTLERIAVGDHVLLGGDNMDLALAAACQKTFTEDGKTLDAMQSLALVSACRDSKERLLSDDKLASVPLVVGARGSKLFGGALKTTVTQAQVQMLVDGFFPEAAISDRAKRRSGMGLRELGLPYAHDPAITRHLVEFLSRTGRKPTAVLFNGGVMKAPRLRARICENLARWVGAPVRELPSADLDLAVALGAAHYGQVRQGKGVRVRGGTARAYYIGVESSAPAIPGIEPPLRALCVAPLGMEEGDEVALPIVDLGLVVGELSTFRFFASPYRKDDLTGAIIDAATETLVELAPLAKEIEATGERKRGDIVPITLKSHVTTTGTLEVWCLAEGDGGKPNDKWKLEYSLRDV